MSTLAVPTTIDFTGTLDVTAKLAAFLNSAPRDTRIDFPTNGKYRVDGTVKVGGRWGLDVRGHGSTLFANTAGTHDRSQLVLTGGGNVNIDALIIQGANAAGGTSDAAWDVTREGQHCLQLDGVHGACLTNLNLSHSFGDCLYLNRNKIGPSGVASSYDWSYDIWLHNSYLHHSGRQGITFQGVRDSVVTANRIEEIRRSTFEFEPLAAAFNGATGIHLTDNDIGLGRLNLIAAHGSGPVDDIWLEDNRIGRPLQVTVGDDAGARRSGWHINRNVATGLPAGGTSAMDFTRVDGVEVTGNVQTVKAGRGIVLVHATACTGVDVFGNTVTNGTQLLKS